MSLTISFELGDDDLAHFRGLMKQAKSAAKQQDDEDILTGTTALIEELRSKKLPDFIRERVGTIETMKTMLQDVGFNLPAPERRRVLSALAYFLDPDDLIADDIPVLGFLDDAIMIELVRVELEHELQAYDDFCKFRTREASRRGVEVSPLTREKWMGTKRSELINRIRTRRAGRRSRSML